MHHRVGDSPPIGSKICSLSLRPYNATALLGDGPCTEASLGYNTPQEYFNRW